MAAEDLVLIARSDGLAVEGFEATIDRCNAYAEAGADVIFFEAPQTVEQIREIGRRIETPLLINMFAGGKTPMVPLADLAEWGYRIVIVPSDLQRAAILAMQEVLAAIARDGDSSGRWPIAWSPFATARRSSAPTPGIRSERKVQGMNAPRNMKSMQFATGA